jgi:superoxide dismutase, Cu-Zn family
MRFIITGVCLTLAASACTPRGMGGSTESAAATMRDAAGHDLGELRIAETSDGLRTTGTLHGLMPGPHGIHLHAVGQCDAPFASAGGHWNPTARQHGFSNPLGAHTGDMQNIEVSADSTATIYLTTRGGTLHGANGLLDGDGAAIVIHAAADDYRTDPAGNSGARVACGVIKGN